MTLDEALKRISDLETEVKQASATATKAERERAIGMLEAAKAFSQDTDTAIKAINKAKWDVEDATDFFTSLKAAKDSSTGIDTSVVPFGKAPEKAAGASNELYVPAFLKQKEGAK